jgi:heme-degrading monooxygenase HmoA
LIVRSWSARATPEGAESYRRHFENDVLPSLRAIPGQRGALLLRRPEGVEAELVVLTFWDSMDAISAFAGSAATTAVVAPEARAVLKDYDREVRIFETLMDARS